MNKHNINECGLALALGAVFLCALSISGLDEPDVEISISRYVDRFQFFDLQFLNMSVTKCKTITGSHADYLDCAPYFFKIFALKLTQYASSVFLLLVLLRLIRAKFAQHATLSLIFISPSFVYFSSNLTPEFIAYLLAIVLPFQIFKVQVLLCIAMLAWDVGNGVVASTYVLVSNFLPRSSKLTSSLLVFSFINTLILTEVFSYLSNGNKLFDVLNYVLNINGENTLFPLLYIPVTIASLLFMTPDFVGLVSSSFIAVVYTVCLVNSRKFLQTLHKVYVSPSFQTIVVFVSFLPTHAYGKYYLFFLVELLVILSFAIGTSKVFKLQTIFTCLVTVEVLIWSLA